MILSEAACNDALFRMLDPQVEGCDWVYEALAEDQTWIKQLANLMRDELRGRGGDAEVGKHITEHIFDYLRETQTFQKYAEAAMADIARARQEGGGDDEPARLRGAGAI